MLHRELHIPLLSPPMLWCDNSSALALASNLVFHARTKHIEVDFHFVREKVTNKDIKLRYLSTLDQIANIFTKGHTANRFCFLRDKLRVCAPISLQGGVKSHLDDSSISKSTTTPSQSDQQILSSSPVPVSRLTTLMISCGSKCRNHGHHTSTSTSSSTPSQSDQQILS
jgi:hypothetical protein